MDVGYDVVRSQIGRAATSCTPYDAEAAAKVGVRTIGVLCSFPEADLRGAGDVAILRNPPTSSRDGPPFSPPLAADAAPRLQCSHAVPISSRKV